MNILILGAYFEPRQSPRSFRTTNLAKSLSNIGNSVTVATFENDYVVSDQYKESIKVDLLQFSKFHERICIKLRELPRLYSLLNYMIEFDRLKYLMPTIVYLRPKFKEFDVVITIASPHILHWATSIATWNLSSVKWLADCGDPFYKNEMLPRKPPLYFKWIEGYFLSKASAVIVPLSKAIESYSIKYHEKFKVIPQGFFIGNDSNTLNKLNKQSFLSQTKNEAGIIKLAYAGSFLKYGRNPTKLFTQFNLLGKSYQLHIFSRTSIDPYIKHMRTGNIIIHDPLPRDKLLNRLIEFDYLIDLSNISSSQLPSKLIDYFISGVPIISVNQFQDFDSWEELLEHKIDDIRYNAIKSEMGRFESDAVAQKFIEVIDELA